VVPGVDPIMAMVETAARLRSATIVMGSSPRLTPAEQAKQFGDAWEDLPAPRPQVSLEIVQPGEEQTIFFNLGPHPPRLWPEDVDLVHGLWLKLSGMGPGAKLHHRDIVRVALRRLEAEIDSGRSRDVLRQIEGEHPKGAPPAASGESPRHGA
jgi:hypothetical protein